MIDLGYLTEDEQEMILMVLKRDAEVKKMDEQRIKKLQKTERDKSKLKFLTGEWFYETTSRRHRDRIHGSDIVRASMKQRKPVTILEISQIWPEKPSFLNNESKDVFIPPELSGILEESPSPSQDKREDGYQLAVGVQPEKNNSSAQPQVKPRQNPFNSKPLGSETPKKADGSRAVGESQPGPAGVHQTPAGVHQTPAGVQQTPARVQQTPMGMQKTPAGVQKTPTAVQQTSAGVQQTSAGVQQTPAGVQQTAMGVQQTPAGVQQAPMGVQQTSAEVQQKPAAGPQTPAVVQQTPAVVQQTPAESHLAPAEVLPPQSETSVPSNTNQNSESSLMTKPVAKKRLPLYSSYDFVLDTTSDPVLTLAMSPSRRGILKQSSSSCSFNDSLSPQASFGSQPASPFSPESSKSSHSPPLSPNSDCSSLGGLDRKQVRFSSTIQAKDAERQDVQESREHGENSLLDQDCSSPSDQEGEPDTIEAPDMSNPLLYHCTYEIEKFIGETDSVPLASAQSSSVTLLGFKPLNLNEEDRNEKGQVGEFPGCRNWSEGNDYTTSTSQSLTDHEDHAEPHSSQVSEDHGSLSEQGKAAHLSSEGQTHMLTEEEGSSIAKVLEWFGRVSRDSGKMKERPSLPEEQNKEGPESQCTVDTGNTSPTQTEKDKPSPKPRRGLLSLFSRAETKVEMPECVLTKEDVVCCNEDKKVETIPECQAPQTSTNVEVASVPEVPNVLSELNTVPEEGETRTLPIKTEDVPLYTIADEDGKQNESPGQNERSPSRLASLKSFWERGNKGPKILSIKKSADANQNEPSYLNEDGDTDQKRPEVSNISPSKATPCFESSKSADSLIQSRHEADSFIPSQEEKTTHFEIEHEDEHCLQSDIVSEDAESSPVKQKDEAQTRKLSDTPPPVPSIRMPLPLADSEPATYSGLKSFWEKEKHGPKIIIRTPEATPEISNASASKDHTLVVHETPLNVDSAIPEPVGGAEKTSSSLNREDGASKLSLKDKIERSPRKRSPRRDPDKSALDGGDEMSPSTQRAAPLKSVLDKGKKFSPRSSPIRNVSTGLQDHSQQSTGNNRMTDPTPSRTPSPRHQSKVPPRDLYPLKEARKRGSPLRAFNIDISQSDRISVEWMESPNPSPNKGQTERPGGESLVNESSNSDRKDLAEELKEHHMTPPEQKSKTCHLAPPQYASQHFEKPQSPTTPSVGDVDGNQISSDKSSPGFQGQTSALGQTSPVLHRKTSDEGADIRPIMLQEQKQSIDLQSTPRLARSYIPCYQHYLGLPESAHIPGLSVQLDRQEWGRVGEGSEQVTQGRRSNESSPSRHSQLESGEITFDSSRSASPEAWSRSRTSSACGSEEPSPISTALKRVSVRPISLSKSLEDIASKPSREERRKNDARSDFTLSVEDVSGAPHATSSSHLDPEQMKMLSVSVPAFMQQQSSGRDSDCGSVNSFYSERQRKGSTITNVSVSSGLTSMSSVSGSVISIYGSDVEVKGTIQFAINYVQKLGEFHIFVVQCKDLAVAEPKKNRSDPYIKCYLLPDKAKLGKRKTTVKKKTLNPTYNEILRYKIPLESLKTQTLNLSVWHNDTFGKNSFLGEVNMDLSEWDSNNTQIMDYALKGRVPVQSSPKRFTHSLDMTGEIRIALRFLPQPSQSKKASPAGEVQIWVKECKNLPSRGGTINPFVKCAILPDTSRKSRQKTRAVRKTTNPVFNHTMVYDGFRQEDLREACVELTVWDQDRLSNHFIGGTRLGLGTGKSYGSEVDWMDSNTAEAGLWKRMIESQNDWVEDVLPLRMFVISRTMSR